MSGDAGGGGRRVLVVSHEASRSGAPRMAVHLVAALAASGWTVEVCHRWGGPLVADLAAAAGPTGRSFREPAAVLRVALRRIGLRRMADLLGVRSAARVVRRVRPDLVVANTVLSSAFVAAAARAGVPSVLYGHEVDGMAAYGVGQAGLAGAAGVGADGLVRLGSRPGPVLPLGCSEPAAARLAEVLGLPPGSVEVLHSCVDVAEVVRRAGMPMADLPAAVAAGDAAPSVVLACGTADRLKGADLFLEAATRHRASGGRARWVWVGRGGEGRPGPVEWLGESPDPLPLVGAATVVVVPSRSDAFPLVVLEAMALERPVVAAAVGGIPGQLGDTGVLVAPEDPEALLEAVERLLGDASARAALGRRAGERCRDRWDLPRFEERLSRLLERVVD